VHVMQCDVSFGGQQHYVDVNLESAHQEGTGAADAGSELKQRLTTMGYSLTTSPEPENAVPGKSDVSPKTHVPGSRVKERGHRYYMPETGRWVSRDPLGDETFPHGTVGTSVDDIRQRLLDGRVVLLYSYLKNEVTDRIDAFGLVDVVGCGSNTVAIKTAFENACKQLNDDSVTCCIGKMASPKMKSICADTNFKVTCLPAGNSFCAGACAVACNPGNLGWPACQVAGYGKGIYICDGFFNSTGCPNTPLCMMLHELGHMGGMTDPTTYGTQCCAPECANSFHGGSDEKSMCDMAKNRYKCCKPKPKL
jgi:hypothetical protein